LVPEPASVSREQVPVLVVRDPRGATIDAVLHQAHIEVLEEREIG